MKRRFAIVGALCSAVWMALPAFAAAPGAPGEVDGAKLVEYQRYVKARQLVAQHYVDPKKMDDVALLFASLRGMIWSVDPLGDCWTAEEYPKFQALKNSSTEEMGLRWAIKNRGAVVLNVVPKSPADRANVKPGDFLAKINGKELPQGISLAELDRVCYGSGRTSVLEFFHTRTELTTPVTLKAERLTDAMSVSTNEGIGVWTVGSGKRALPEDGRQKLKSLRPAQLQGLVLDLRRTSDLSMDTAASMAGCFQGPDQSVWGYLAEGAQVTALSLTRGEDVYTDVPMVVIVDRSTSGAAEILAAALGDSHRAVVIGQQTAGFVPSQVERTLQNGIVCRLTKGWYQGIRKEDIHEKGVEPMIKVELPVRQTEDAAVKKQDEKDPYLEKAKMLLNAVAKARAMSSRPPSSQGPQ